MWRGAGATDGGAMTLLRKLLATVAVLACLPYVGLKLLWLTGSSVGLNDPTLLDGGVMEVANLATLLMELTAAALAVLLVLPVGRRVPSLIVQVPMFVGTGLLGAILLVIPAQLLVGAGSGGTERAALEDEPIQGWVYAMVYGGFSVLGLCLLTIFVLHSWERWVRPGGWTAWMGSWGPAPVRRRTIAIGHGLTLVAVCLVELVVIARADLLGGHQLVSVTLAVAALVGLTTLALRAPSGLRGSVPLVLAYAGSAGVAAWGLYFAAILSIPNPLRGEDLAIPAGLIVVELVRGVVGALTPLTIHRLRPVSTRSHTPAEAVAA